MNRNGEACVSGSRSVQDGEAVNHPIDKILTEVALQWGEENRIKDGISPYKYGVGNVQKL